MERKKKIGIKLLFIHIVVLTVSTSFAQCPVNIGFELGTLDHWTPLIGTIDKLGNINLNTSSADPERHKIYKDVAPQELDPYGKFPVNCPNASGYSVRLGNAISGAQAEGLSYEFTIPADKNYYSVIYNYAVVLQNPGHMPFEQPRFTAKVFDVDAGAYIGCSSFDYTASAGLPGFQTSSVSNNVVFKPWSPVTIKLNGYAGKTIRLEFTTNDCSKGGHFGYAYLDVDEDCSSPVKGSVLCPRDQSMTLIAPYGFSDYRWFPLDFSKVLGVGDSIHLVPIPAANTIYAVELTPFPNQGCLDTVYATIRYSADTVILKTPAQPVSDCVTEGVDITNSLVTAGSSPGLVYTYFTDPGLTTHLFSPDSLLVSGTYYIKATNEDGCFASKPVVVKVDQLPVFSLSSAGKVTLVRPNTLDMYSIISGNAGINYTFWKDTLATIPLPGYSSIDKPGTYYIKASTAAGCSVILPVTLKIDDPPVYLSNAFSPNGDGINDEWDNPSLKNYTDCIVEIFSRSGQQVFRSVGYGTPWDGKQNGKNLPGGTYYYVIKLAPDKLPFGGSVTIIR